MNFTVVVREPAPMGAGFVLKIYLRAKMYARRL